MPADYLSRHPIDEVVFGYQNENGSYKDTLIVEQYRDELCQELKYYLENRKINPRTPARISKLVNERGIDMFIQDGLIWRRRTRNDYPEWNGTVLPQSLKQDIIEAAH